MTLSTLSRTALAAALLLALAPASLAQDNNARGASVAPGIPSTPEMTSPFKGGSVTFYSDRATFDAANPGLPVEDFEAFTEMAPFCDDADPLDSTTRNDYANPGDILPGIAFREGPELPRAGEVCFFDENYAGTPSNAIVTDNFEESLEIITDPAVRAVGFNLGNFNQSTAKDYEVRVYDAANNLLGMTTVTGVAQSYVFVGIESNVANVTRVNILGLDAGNEVIDDVAFGSATTSVPDVDIAYISSTANPQRGETIFIRARATNNESSAVRTRFYFTVDGPEGFTRTVSVLSADFPANTTVQVQKIKKIKFRVPASAPAGAYTVTLFVADDLAGGGESYDTDSFMFTLPPMPWTAAPASGASALTSPEAGPNPFTTSTTLRYELADDAEVDLRVFDATGREVAVLARGYLAAGVQSATFRAGDLPSGVYMWRLAADGAVRTGRITLAR